MRIVHVDNLRLHHYGREKFFTGRKLLHGLIRNNWRVCAFSDADVAYFEAPLHVREFGLRIANRRLIETCDSFRPDLVILGFCDIIRNATLRAIRDLLPGVRIACWNVDSLWQERNIGRLRLRMDYADALFVTTGGETLRQFCTARNVVAYMPNPTDPAVDDQDNSAKTAFDRDLVFCSGRPPEDPRYAFVGRLHETLRGQLRFESFGLHGRPAVWGRAYEEVLAGSKMGLNLNHIEDWPLYSSDRIAQLMGNGLLTFLWDKGDMRRLFDDRHAVFFRDADHLAAQVRAFHADDARRRAVAAAGRAWYHEHYSAERVARFIAETTLGLPYSHAYTWAGEVYRSQSSR